jgi:hypothetical protein
MAAPVGSGGRDPREVIDAKRLLQRRHTGDHCFEAVVAEFALVDDLRKMNGQAAWLEFKLNNADPDTIGKIFWLAARVRSLPLLKD